MKKPWQSKTLWVNLAFAVLAFFPAVKDYLGTEGLASMITAANMVLRVISKDKISLE